MANPATRRFQIALSFSSEHRNIIEKVANILAESLSEEKILYDNYWQHEFSRPSLDVYLPNLYRNNSELIVIFLCPEYKVKHWCRLEWRFIKELILTTDQSRIMLLKFGDPGDLSEIGILSGDGSTDISGYRPEEIAELILKRYEQDGSVFTPPRTSFRKVLRYLKKPVVWVILVISGIAGAGIYYAQSSATPASKGATKSPSLPPSQPEFENSLNDASKWEREIWGKGNSISFADNEEGIVLKIESKFGYDAAWIESPLVRGPNVFLLEALVKGENLVIKSEDVGAKGKFQVVRIKDGRDVGWTPHQDFEKTAGWEPKHVAMTLAPNESAVFRIGLQKTQGVVYIKNLRVINIGIK